jgi:LacI family transcriptional regulator
MGYRPNPMVSALMTQLRRTKVQESSSALAFLTTHPTRDGWKKIGVGWDFYQGAKTHAEKLGFDLEIIWAKEPGMTGTRLSAILHTRNVRGIIVAPLARPCGHLTLNWNLFSSVILGFSSYRPSLHRAASNTFQGTRLALRKLWQMGYRRIGLVIPNAVDTRTNYAISAAYLRFQHDVKYASQMMLPHFPSGKSFDAKFMNWFRKHRPDALLSMIPEVKLWLEKEEGLKAPRDYGLAMLSISKKEVGAYAGLDQRDEQVGAAAVKIVSEQIFHGETGVPSIPQTVLIEGVWLDGPTVQVKS